MSMQPIDRNGDVRLNGPAMALIFFAVLLVLYKLGVNDRIISELSLPRYLQSGWTIVVLSFVSMLMFAISLDRVPNPRYNRPDSWILRILGFSTTVFILSVFWMLMDAIFFG